MKLKMTEDGKGAVVVDGKPVYIHDDGKEVPLDAAELVSSLNRVIKESKTYKERAQEVEQQLKPFEGIDPEAARKALETVANLDAGKLLTAGKVEEMKAGIVKSVEDKFLSKDQAQQTLIRELTGERDGLKNELFSEKVGGRFARSEFIAKKAAVPADVFQALFGNRFEVSDGKVVGKDKAGNPIYSRGKPGEIADFDEAIEVMLDAYPGKDSLLKGTGAQGDGKRQNNGANQKVNMEGLTPVQKMNIARGIVQQ